MNQRFSIRRLLQLIVIMLIVCGYFTPLKAQEIIEYDYVCTRYEDGAEDDDGMNSKIRIRFENEKVFLNCFFKDAKDWNVQKKKPKDYIWQEFKFDCMEDNQVWFSLHSEEEFKENGMNVYLVISEDRETVMYVDAFTDDTKKTLGILDKSDIFSRSKPKESNRPSWIK